MTEPHQKNSIVKCAKDVEARAATWLEHRVSEGWNNESQIAFDAWIAESWAHRTAYLRLKAAWARADRLSALRRPASERERIAANRKSKVLKAIVVTAIAATIGVGAASIFSRQKEKVYTTAVGAHETVMLADGSRIELNTDTAIRVAERTNRRTVRLDRGEAFFHIKHDAARPFVVEADGRYITDVGTKFTVRREGGQLQVAVVEGRVRFDAGVQSHQTLLASGDFAVAKAGSISVTRISPKKLATELGWRYGVLVFDRTTLAAAAAEFNRYNREKLVIADPATARLMIYGTFPTGDVKAFTRVAQEVFGLHVENLGGESVISR